MKEKTGGKDKTKQCNQYSSEDYKKYIFRDLNTEDAKKFKSHYMSCCVCQEGVMQTNQQFLREKEKEDNRLMYEKAMELLDAYELELKSKVNIIDIVVNFLEGGLKILKTSAEILAPGPVSAYRGANGHPEEQNMVRVVQDFVSPAVSLQVSVRCYQEKSSFTIDLSVFDKQKEVFLDRYNAILSGNALHDTVHADENGETFFHINGAGDYRIDMYSGDLHIGSIHINLCESS